MFTKKSYIVKAILFTLIGLLFILFPATISKYIMLFIGTTIILYGVINLVTAVKMDISYKLKLTIIICVIGALFLLLSGFILSVIGIIFAIYCLINGFSSIGLALRRKEMKLPYIFQLIKGSITLIISVFFFVLPSSFINIQIMILGGYLLISAINQIYKAYNEKDKETDFFNFYFHKQSNDTNEEQNIIDNNSIIDAEVSVKDDEN